MRNHCAFVKKQPLCPLPPARQNMVYYATGSEAGQDFATAGQVGSTATAAQTISSSSSSRITPQPLTSTRPWQRLQTG